MVVKRTLQEILKPATRGYPDPAGNVRGILHVIRHVDWSEYKKNRGLIGSTT